jgi:hypothetical protein
MRDSTNATTVVVVVVAGARGQLTTLGTRKQEYVVPQGDAVLATKTSIWCVTFAAEAEDEIARRPRPIIRAFIVQSVYRLSVSGV